MAMIYQTKNNSENKLKYDFNRCEDIYVDLKLDLCQNGSNKRPAVMWYVDDEMVWHITFKQDYREIIYIDTIFYNNLVKTCVADEYTQYKDFSTRYTLNPEIKYQERSKTETLQMQRAWLYDNINCYQCWIPKYARLSEIRRVLMKSHDTNLDMLQSSELSEFDNMKLSIKRNPFNDMFNGQNLVGKFCGISDTNPLDAYEYSKANRHLVESQEYNEFTGLYNNLFKYANIAEKKIKKKCQILKKHIKLVRRFKLDIYVILVMIYGQILQTQILYFNGVCMITELNPIILLLLMEKK